MKRSYIHARNKIDILSKQIASLEQKRESVNNDLIENEKFESRTEIQRFIHNAHLFRFPPLRNNRSESEYFNPPLCRTPTSITLHDIMRFNDVVPFVLAHLGPCELTMLATVAHDFDRIVGEILPCIIDTLVHNYTVGIETGVPSQRKYVMDASATELAMKTTMKKYKEMVPEKRPSIREVLRVCHTCICLTRKYGTPLLIDKHKSCFVQYAFAYHTETRRLIPLSNLNCYQFNEAHKVFTGVSYRLRMLQVGRFLEDYKNEEMLPYFRYDDLCHVDMERILDHKTKPYESYLFESDSITPFDKSGYQVYYCDPSRVPTDSMVLERGELFAGFDGTDFSNRKKDLAKDKCCPTNRSPFFDHYTMRAQIESPGKHLYVRRKLSTVLDEFNQLIDALLK